MSVVAKGFAADERKPCVRVRTCGGMTGRVARFACLTTVPRGPRRATGDQAVAPQKVVKSPPFVV